MPAPFKEKAVSRIPTTDWSGRHRILNGVAGTVSESKHNGTFVGETDYAMKGNAPKSKG